MNPEEIKRIIDSQHPDDQLSRLGDFENKKVWPQGKQIVIDWRMPQDAQRVMIFEKLGYLIDQKMKSSKVKLEQGIKDMLQ